MRFCAAFRDLIGPLSQTIKMTLSYRGAYITCHRSSVSIHTDVFKMSAAQHKEHLRRRLLHDRWLTCSAIWSAAALGVLFEWLVVCGPMFRLVLRLEVFLHAA